MDLTVLYLNLTVLQPDWTVLYLALTVLYLEGGTKFEGLRDLLGRVGLALRADHVRLALLQRAKAVD